MKLSNRIRLIPRNNWDYGLGALFKALANTTKDSIQAPNTQTLFKQDQIWTKSGRASLFAILKALGLPTGSRVGVPLFCCSVVFNAICEAGLKPSFIDSDLEDCNISAEDLGKKRADLAALVVVHMFGVPCDMDAVNEIAGDMPVIEDCAQALFSTYKGKLTGSLSTASFFSFRCGKYISAGEGSAIFCRDPGLQRKIEQTVGSFEDWSVSEKFIDSASTFAKATLYNRPWYGLIGHPVGMRLDKKLNLTAKDGFEAGKIASTHLALIDARMANFQEKIAIQKSHAQMLLESVTPVHFSLPPEMESDRQGNWFQFALKFDDTSQRDAMAAHLFNYGIDTSKYLDDIADEARAKYGYEGNCPNAELLSKTTLLIPIHYTLKAKDIEYIARSINEGTTKI